MPRVCKVTGKKTQVGMNVSHSMRHTKRTFLPNLQKLKFHSDILNRDFSLRISTAGLRTLTKHGGLDAYVMSKSPSRLAPEMAAIKKAINKKIGKTEKPAKKPVHKANRSARLVKKVEARPVAELVDALDSKSSSARSVGSSPTRATRNINHHFGGFYFGPMSDEKPRPVSGPMFSVCHPVAWAPRSLFVIPWVIKVLYASTDNILSSRGSNATVAIQ